MKKEGLKSAVALIALCITFLTACHKDGEIVDPFLQQTSNELNFSWEGEEKGFAITTNGGAWTISAPDAPWITFDVTSGEGKGKREPILATVALNRGEAREGKILIQAGGQQSEITVRQEDGRLVLGEAALEPGSLALGEQIANTYLKFPYQKGIPGDELTFSVAITGDGAAGIDPITDFSVVLDAQSGEISIPLSGTPTAVGEVILTLSVAGDVEVVSTIPAPVSAEVLDLNQPHPDAAAFVISGWLANPTGANESGGNYEYMQFLALRDINFANENFSVITCNNAGQTDGVPPAEGWVTGGTRTYKFNITSGTVQKGEYFYVGGTSGKINGPTSVNSIPANKWVKQHQYNVQPGDDGVGAITNGNLLAHTGLTYGVAVFRGTAVDHDTEPMDVVFLRNPIPSYTLFGLVNGEDRGFRVTNTDYYTVTDVIKYINQFDASGTYHNVASVGGTPASATQFAINQFLELRGVYNVVTATWTTPRSKNIATLNTNSTLADIETETSTKMFPAP